MNLLISFLFAALLAQQTQRRLRPPQGRQLGPSPQPPRRRPGT